MHIKIDTMKDGVMAEALLDIVQLETSHEPVPSMQPSGRHHRHAALSGASSPAGHSLRGTN
jgi:hypothetical protein